MELRERTKKIMESGFTVGGLSAITGINKGTLYNFTSNKTNLSKHNREVLECEVSKLERILLENDTKD